LIKTILGEQGFEIDSREKTEEEKLEESLRSCQMQCDWENSQIGNLNEFDGYDCPLCKNKGYFVKPNLYLKRYTADQVMCRCDKVRRTILSLKRSGLEDVVHEYRFENYETKEPWQKNALELAMRYTENYKDSWLFIGGATGRGKTHLCTAAAISLLKKGNEVKYMLWRDEARRLKSIVNDPEYNKDIQFYKSVDVLYIDDLFKTGRGMGKTAQLPTEADINLAFEIINSRAIQKKPTIISSESNLLEILEIDEAIGGRIKQRCGDYYFNIGAKNTKNYRTE
jgi:DNA replication protein DnaC